MNGENNNSEHGQLKKVQIYLFTKDLDFLSLLATKRGTKSSVVVREAVRTYVDFQQNIERPKL